MTAQDDNQQREDLESQVWNAIAAFEQIVETIPNDRVSLEALSHAYEQVGDLSRAREYLSRLVNVVIEEQDRDTAELLRERLVRFSVSEPLAREIQARVDAFLASGIEKTKKFEISAKHDDEALSQAEESERRSSHVASELSFAWTLFQAAELNQEEYAAVAQDLSAASSATASLATVSVLHALHDRGSRSLERVIAFAAKDTGVPVIPLALFEVQDSVFGLIARDFMIRYGVMAFEMMGQDVLVVVLNPYNKSIREKVASITGRRCHFFMTMPADFDATLARHNRKEPGKLEETAAATP